MVRSFDAIRYNLDLGSRGYPRNMKKLIDSALVLILVASLGYMVYLSRTDGSFFGTPTPTLTATVTATTTPTVTMSPTMTSTPTHTLAPSRTPTQTFTPTPSPTSTPTQTLPATAATQVAGQSGMP